MTSKTTHLPTSWKKEYRETKEKMYSLASKELYQANTWKRFFIIFTMRFMNT